MRGRALACVRKEQLRAGQAQRHPQKVPEAPGPVDVHTAELLLLLGLRVAVQTHGTKESRQAKQVVSVQMRDENLGYSTWVEIKEELCVSRGSSGLLEGA